MGAPTGHEIERSSSRKSNGPPGNGAPGHWNGLVAVLQTLPEGQSRVTVVITIVVAGAVVALAFVAWRYVVWLGG